MGTHTHIPTNDARIFPKGLAFLSDAGMTGPWHSCLGRKWEPILQKFIDGRPRPFVMAEGDDRICAVIIDIDTEKKRAVFVEPFIYPPFPNSAELWQKAKEAEAAERAAKEAAKAAAEAPANDAEQK